MEGCARWSRGSCAEELGGLLREKHQADFWVSFAFLKYNEEFANANQIRHDIIVDQLCLQQPGLPGTYADRRSLESLIEYKPDRSTQSTSTRNQPSSVVSLAVPIHPTPNWLRPSLTDPIKEKNKDSIPPTQSKHRPSIPAFLDLTCLNQLFNPRRHPAVMKQYFSHSVCFISRLDGCSC